MEWAITTPIGKGAILLALKTTTNFDFGHKLPFYNNWEGYKWNFATAPNSALPPKDFECASETGLAVLFL